MQAVILAAGASSRFWPLGQDKHKALLKVMGKPLISYTIESLEDIGINEVIVVQSPKKDVESEIGDSVGSVSVKYVVQEEPKGMGNAIEQARDLIKERFFVLNAYRKNASKYLKPMVEKSNKTGAQMVLLGAKTDTPWKYGILGTDGDKAHTIIEKPEKGEEPSNTKVVGMYLLPKDFLEYHDGVKEHQYSYEDAIQRYMDKNDVRVIMTDEPTTSIKYPWDLFGVTKELIKDMKPQISESAKIDETAKIEGKVYIGENVRVFEHAIIRGPVYIGDNCIIGNNSLVRDYTNLEKGVTVGANSEVRGTIIQEKTSIHSTFLGDCIIGENCRFGAGCVVANRMRRVNLERPNISFFAEKKGKKVDTGTDRLGVIMGNRTEVATMCNIMPGTAIGRNSFVGPSSLVLKNVKDNSIFYSKHEGVTKSKEE